MEKESLDKDDIDEINEWRASKEHQDKLVKVIETNLSMFSFSEHTE